MKSTELTDAQLQALRERLGPSITFLGRLEQRMANRGFPADDRLLVLIQEARKSLQDVIVELHYLSCDNVGEPRT